MLSPTEFDRLQRENPTQAAEFAVLNFKLQRDSALSPDSLRVWCQLGLELGHTAAVQNVCEHLLAQNTAHAALRPYWLFFLGSAYLHQFKVDEGVAVLRQALSALCIAPRHYQAQINPTPLADPAIEQQLWQTLSHLAIGGIRAFAHAGTLLGLVRENRLLPFDKDLDLALLVEELPLADQILQANGWHRPAQAFNIDNLWAYQHHDSGVVLDLCGLAMENGTPHLIGGFWINNLTPLHHQRLSRFPGPVQLEQWQSPAGLVWRLQHPEPWLTAMYGPHWRTPDPMFDTIIGAHHLLGFSSLTQWYAYSKICNAWLNGHWEKALRLSQIVLTRHTPDDSLLQQVAQILQSHLASLNRKN